MHKFKTVAAGYGKGWQGVLFLLIPHAYITSMGGRYVVIVFGGLYRTLISGVHLNLKYR